MQHAGEVYSSALSDRVLVFAKLPSEHAADVATHQQNQWKGTYTPPLSPSCPCLALLCDVECLLLALGGFVGLA